MPKFPRPNGYVGKQATQTWTGQGRFANQEEAQAGDSTKLAISPATLAGVTTALVAAASSTIAGVVKTTDNSSPVATKLYVDTVAMTALKTNQLLASPPVIGGTHPAAGHFTTLTATGLVSFTGSANINTGASPLNLGADAANGAINLGTGGSRIITLGNATTGTSLVVSPAAPGLAISKGGLKIATSGFGLQIKGGAATDYVGHGTLVNGILLIPNTNIRTGDLILLQRISANGSVSLGELSYSISNGISFTISSLNGSSPANIQLADKSTFAYQIIRPL